MSRTIRHCFGVKKFRGTKLLSGRDVEEQWFAGVHSDLANGYNDNTCFLWRFLSRLRFSYHLELGLCERIRYWFGNQSILAFAINDVRDTTTLTNGHIVKGWLLEPIKNEIFKNSIANCRRTEFEGCEEDEITHLMYDGREFDRSYETAMWVILLPGLIHTSFFEGSNVFGWFDVFLPFRHRGFSFTNAECVPSHFVTAAKKVYEHFPEFFPEIYGKMLTTSGMNRGSKWKFYQLERANDPFHKKARENLDVIRNYLYDEHICERSYNSVDQIADMYIKQSGMR